MISRIPVTRYPVEVLQAVLFKDTQGTFVGADFFSSMVVEVNAVMSAFGDDSSGRSDPRYSREFIRLTQQKILNELMLRLTEPGI